MLWKLNEGVQLKMCNLKNIFTGRHNLAALSYWEESDPTFGHPPQVFCCQKSRHNVESEADDAILCVQCEW